LPWCIFYLFYIVKNTKKLNIPQKKEAKIKKY